MDKVTLLRIAVALIGVAILITFHITGAWWLMPVAADVAIRMFFAKRTPNKGTWK